MAKLAPEKAASVAEQRYTKPEEYVNYRDPVPSGAYLLRFLDVDTTRQGPAGPYWSWVFEHVEAPYTKKRHYVNTSLSEAAEWKLRETFEAFGVSMDTDTDELRGRIVEGVIAKIIIGQGSRKGEMGNNVDRLNPATPEDVKALGELPEMDYVSPTWDDNDDPDEDVPF